MDSGYAPCGCYVGAWWGVVPPPRCAGHSGVSFVPMAPQSAATTTLRFASLAPLSDEDIDRIARRVVELLRDKP